MATMDIFEGDAFSIIELTRALENIPFKPAILSGAGLFANRGVRARTVMIESRDGTLSLIPFSERGSAYEQQVAPAEIHRVLFDPQAPTTPIGAPVRMLRGWVDGVTFNEAGSGTGPSEHTVELTLVSHARGLTVPLPLRRSDASYRLRGGDRIGRYCDVSGSVPIHWGEAR